MLEWVSWHSWAKWQNPPKTRFKKFVRLMDHTYACNSLTNFEYKANNWKQKLCESAETC
jgi:hypothetical protein